VQWVWGQGLTHVDCSLAAVVRQGKPFEGSSSSFRDGTAHRASVNHHFGILLLQQWQEVLGHQEGANNIHYSHSRLNARKKSKRLAPSLVTWLRRHSQSVQIRSVDVDGYGPPLQTLLCSLLQSPQMLTSVLSAEISMSDLGWSQPLLLLQG